MLTIMFVGAVCLSSCDDDDEGGISGNGGLKGYYIADRPVHKYGYDGTCYQIKYFQGDGKGFSCFGAATSKLGDDCVKIVEAGGKTYYIESWLIKPMVYEIIGGNTISIISTDGTTETLYISDGQISGYSKLK